MSEIDEVVGDFLAESQDNLDQMDRDLLALEADPQARDTLAGIFRTVHTIKGTCGFLGFHRLQALTHVAENLLGRLRDGDVAVTPEVTSTLLATGDAIRRMLGAIEASGGDDGVDAGAVVDTLAALCQKPGPSADVPAEAPPEDAAAPRQVGDILVGWGVASRDDVTLAAGEQALGDGRRLGEILVDHGVAQAEDVADALDAQREPQGTRAADASIRVGVDLLDDLMNLVGELVLVRNQVRQLAGRADAALAAASQRLNLITTELQDGVMKTRMQPVGQVWGRFPRVVRDLGATCAKRVRVEMSGQETELDRSILEAVRDPLTHLVRNAVDHGVEDPHTRAAAGKPQEGCLSLRAYHEGGQVHIEVGDDGAGIDADRLCGKAVERGLLLPEQAAALTPREALHLVFAPGLSTAPEVTSVSGRGVGLDVVRTSVEAIGGTVEVVSERGRGTTFRVKLPLTLAIIPALVVTAAGERFSIPQRNLRGLVRLDGDEARERIEMVHDVPGYRLRGRLLPLVRLDEQLGLPTAAGPVGDAPAHHIVMVEADGEPFGLVVDTIDDTQEIVVKPLGAQVRDVAVFAGATIMGDGCVSLILDVQGLAQRARVAAGARDRRRAEDTGPRDEAGDHRSLLLVDLAQDWRAAVPLTEVSRLEEFPADAVEHAGGREVVQYRGEILPLLRLGGGPCGAGGAPPPQGPLNVVVHRHSDRAVGLVVGRIIDIVDGRVDLRPAAPGGALLGCAVIQRRVTDVIDVDAVIRAAFPPADSLYR